MSHSVFTIPSSNFDHEALFNHLKQIFSSKFIKLNSLFPGELLDLIPQITTHNFNKITLSNDVLRNDLALTFEKRNPLIHYLSTNLNC